MLSKLLVCRLKRAFNNAKVNRDDDLRNTLILTTGEIGRYSTGDFCLYTKAKNSTTNCVVIAQKYIN